MDVSCNALVICIGSVCLSSSIKMSDFVQVITFEDGRIYGSRTSSVWSTGNCQLI